MITVMSNNEQKTIMRLEDFQECMETSVYEGVEKYIKKTYGRKEREFKNIVNSIMIDAKDGNLTVDDILNRLSVI